MIESRISRVRSFVTFGGVRNWIFVRIETTDGLHGWGEASTELWEGTVRAAVDELGARLLGADALAVERIWQESTRHGFWRGGVVLGSAVAAVDQALWDIKGKRLGVPVHRLLGGPLRDRVETYRHVGIYDAARTAEEARELVASGVRMIKTGAWVTDSVLPERERLARAVDRLTALRDAVGDEVDILLDHHGRARPDEAIRLIAAIAPFRIRWLEEPIGPESPELIAPVAAEARRNGISVAFGERLFSRWEFRTVLERQLVDIVQPDLCHAGGISEVMRIATFADTYRVALAPHNPAGPVSTAASAHVAMAAPNFSVLEFCPDEPRRSEVSIDPWLFNADGFTVPDAPGLGIDLDIEAILDVPPRPIAVPSRAYAGDGSVADV
ncbi:galactonate dehydratase [Herbiconiux sp. UC225_62]|uniref:galactonate dehydratase n=1 Tax=Herbiconiux sp. UC225_62 TaxID=3350168 RepID=UPI0036D3143A